MESCLDRTGSRWVSNIILFGFYSSVNDLLMEGLISVQQRFQSHLDTSSKKSSLYFIQSVHIAQARSAPPQSLPLLANPALSSLKPWTATMTVPMVALLTVVVAGVTLTGLVFSTQLLDLDSGKQCTQGSVLKTAAASRVM